MDSVKEQRYQKHAIQKYRGKSCYPGKADIELYSLTPRECLGKSRISKTYLEAGSF
jgi:hypothetical protein